MTTVREFDGIDDRVLFSIGELSVVGGNVPVTIMALVRLSTSESSWQTVVSYETEEGSERVGLQVFEDGGVLTLFDPFGFDQLTSPGFAPPDEWLLVGMHRPAGENQQIRAHAHKIKGSSLALAAQRMSETAAEMQHQAEEGNFAPLPLGLRRLQQQYRVVAELLQAELARRAASSAPSGGNASRDR